MEASSEKELENLSKDALNRIVVNNNWITTENEMDNTFRYTTP